MNQKKKYSRSNLPVMDNIPPNLITRKEAAKILGLGWGMSINTYNRRFKHLQPIEVVHYDRRLFLYKREDIEALKYEPIPDGYVTSREAGRILGWPNDKPTSYYLTKLRKLNVPKFWHEQHHSQWVYKREALEVIKQQQNKQ